MIELTQRMAKFREKAEQINAELILPAAQEIDRNGEIPLKIMAALWEAGFMTLGVPKEYQGTGAGMLEQALVIEWLSQGSASLGQRLMVQSLGLYPLLVAGNEEQKQKFLGDLVNGSLLTAFALSEPESFDDKEAADTHAEPKGDHYIIDGRKAFVSGSEQADLVTVFAVTDKDAGL